MLIQKFLDLENEYSDPDQRIEMLRQLVSESDLHPVGKAEVMAHFANLWQIGTLDSSDTELGLGSMKLRTNDHDIAVIATTAVAVLAGVEVGVWAGSR